MSNDDDRKSFEETVHAVAQELSASLERFADLDVDEIARKVGLDPERGREWLDGASQWLRASTGPAAPKPAAAASEAPFDAPLDDAGPHPLDTPTAEQGAALAALDSGRWTFEPGTSLLSGGGDGPGPQDGLGLVRELRVRDWIRADGTLTAAGFHALDRWLLSA